MRCKLGLTKLPLRWNSLVKPQENLFIPAEAKRSGGTLCFLLFTRSQPGIGKVPQRICNVFVPWYCGTLVP